MIEILKHGINPDKRQVTTKCPKCGCIFKFEDGEDTFYDDAVCIDYVECPECTELITVHYSSSRNPSKFECDIINEDEL